MIYSRWPLLFGMRVELAGSISGFHALCFAVEPQYVLFSPLHWLGIEYWHDSYTGSGNEKL